MKTRQFKQLAGVSKSRRAALVLEGLRLIASNVTSLAQELDRCNEAQATRASRLAYNAGREEAGKFLILLDVWRAPDASGAQIAQQFDRAKRHLEKLIYAQVADYSLASQSELLRAINRHRQSHYLDGPNDHDWIFRNELIAERENALYVDLVESEGDLEWWAPSDYDLTMPEPFSMRLVRELERTELLTPAGLDVLMRAWKGFNPHADSHSAEWRKRTWEALSAFPETNLEDGTATASASFVVQQWPMPLVELDLHEDSVPPEKLRAIRERAYNAWLESEFGPFE